ncbi:MAG TPA: sulfite exporter TauE/SafE family protein [Actinomycetes bacterium]|nr:sulfite exporter TauE/SafE family protein [Actinomycetes bacterium]
MIDGWEWAAVFAAATAAGAINALVGSGTLVTFSTLVTLGVPPLTANVSNTVGLVAGSVAGSLGYRRELSEQPQRIRRYVPASVLGGVTGAVLLLVLPESAFEAIVPVLVALGVVLFAIQPYMARRLSIAHNTHIVGGITTWTLVYLVGIYGGYFGAAQGVLLIAILGAFVDANLQRVNALKNVLAAVVNAVAAVLFIIVAEVDWGIAVVMTVGAGIGGYLGAHYGRRLPELALRLFIIAVGTVAVVVLVRS